MPRAGFYLNVRSRHETHDVLRRNKRLPFRTIVRLGSTTELTDYPRVECNSVQSIRNSSDKLKMKSKFAEHEVVTADWWTPNTVGTFFVPAGNGFAITGEELPFPIVAKHRFGSRGEGNTLLNNSSELESWKRGKTISNYIFERFYSYSKEYRIHVTSSGAFYCIQKKLKRDTPESDRWSRHDDNSVWITEFNAERDSLNKFTSFSVTRNPAFEIPSNWEVIKAEAVKALNAVGLDIGAIDVKVQSNNAGGRARRNPPKFIILETNSAPSFGEITGKLYQSKIIEILLNKNVQTRNRV